MLHRKLTCSGEHEHSQSNKRFHIQFRSIYHKSANFQFRVSEIIDDLGIGARSISLAFPAVSSLQTKRLNFLTALVFTIPGYRRLHDDSSSEDLRGCALEVTT
eukprot:scaffold4961_cov149-Amphora_coffeaeformis.AAC.6